MLPDVSRCHILVLIICEGYIAVHGSLELSYRSRGSPDFYVNDTILFTCEAADIPLLNVLELCYETFKKGRRGCRTDTEGNWIGRNKPDLNHDRMMESPALSDEYCSLVGVSTGFSITVNVTITDQQLHGYFECIVQNPIGARSKRKKIKQMKVAPKNLTMQFIPNVIVESRPFRVECSSVGGSPESVYKYEIRNGGRRISERDNYIPTEKDRDGIVVQCVDTAHNNWRGGNTSLSNKVYPSYIDDVGSGTVIKSLVRGSTYTLNCTGRVAGRPTPHLFYWTRLHKDHYENSGLFHISSLKIVDTEIITCVASNGIANKSVEIKWLITWIGSSKATTTVSPTANGYGLGVSSVLIITVSAVVFLFIVLTLAAKLYKKKIYATTERIRESERLLSRHASIETDLHTYSYISDSHFLIESCEGNDSQSECSISTRTVYRSNETASTTIHT